MIQKLKPLSLLALFSTLAVVAMGCGSGEDASSQKVALVAYSTPQEAFAKQISAFRSTSVGEQVSFSQSYGASGDQSRAVANGLAADVVNFSYEPDMIRLVEAGKVAKDWDDTPTKGIVTNSVVVFAVREGNPKNIKTWADLTKPGVEVITANPVVSGGARWNLVAAYGQAVDQGASNEEALEYIKSLLKNVSVQDKSARDALQTFSSGKGDVLITYENEVKTAQSKGQKVEAVIPPTTLLIQSPIAVTSDAKSPDAAADFISFLTSDAGQKIWAENGYRPVDRESWAEYGYEPPATLLTIDELGGWEKLNEQLFDADNGEVTKINEELGVSNDG